jgi:hypothetical protein
MEWYKFVVNKEQAFILDTNYLPLMHSHNTHLYMRDGYTWEIYQKADKTETTYYLKSNHSGFTKSILRHFPTFEMLIDKPELDGFICYYGGSKGTSSRNH